MLCYHYWFKDGGDGLLSLLVQGYTRQWCYAISAGSKIHLAVMVCYHCWLIVWTGSNALLSLLVQGYTRQWCYAISAGSKIHLAVIGSAWIYFCLCVWCWPIHPQPHVPITTSGVTDTLVQSVLANTETLLQVLAVDGIPIHVIYLTGKQLRPKPSNWLQQVCGHQKVLVFKVKKPNSPNYGLNFYKCLDRKVRFYDCFLLSSAHLLWFSLEFHVSLFFHWDGSGSPFWY
jgi:hypothetical protein